MQELQKEYTNLEILLQGTQRENERCMAELERCVARSVFATLVSRSIRAKQREKTLEKELEKLMGVNWQVRRLPFGL